MSLIRKSAIMIVVLLLSTIPAYAVEDVRAFKTPAQEALYQALISELRCLVCQNQNIADSNADLAKDLRDKTYELILVGQQKADIKAYMQQRYGDFVLYDPPFNTTTWLLWGGPIVVLGVAIGGLLARVRHDTEPATEAEDSA